jgi:hypothetical protein
MKSGNTTFGGRRAAVLLLLALAGCAASGVPVVDPIHAPVEAATIGYWMDRPATATVIDPDYDRLWKACEAAAASRSFSLERRDYRNGILTTRPLLSAQLLEFWRRDVLDPYSRAESNLATVRRTIQFEIGQVDGKYEARPKVVVERRAQRERRVTAGVLNRNILSGAAVTGYNDYDANVAVPRDYWYAVRRDEALEAKLASDVRRLLPG